MIISEYRREKTKELYYLVIAFSALLLQRLVITIELFRIVFGSPETRLLESVMSIIFFNHFLEAFALILVSHAFIYPIFEKRIEYFRKSVKYQVIVLILLSIVVWAFWLYYMTSSALVDFNTFIGNLLFVLFKILILLYPMYYLIRSTKHDIRYINNLRLAFVFYLTSTILQFINILLFGGTKAKLMVIEHPFPFLAVLLFTRVIYLKLVDKATLKSKLLEAEEKYKVEKEVSKMKDEFISNVSHELRTPLTSMNLYSSMLLSGNFGPLSLKQNKGVKVIKEEVKRLSALIADILTLSKLESKREKLNPEETNLFQLTDNEMYKQLAKLRGITIINKVPKDLVVMIDGQRFKQVYLNLLDNAIKYNKDNGKIKINLKKTKENWALSIADTGLGISDEDLNRIFDKFQQVESQMTKTKRGTGLGLAITKHIIELHGGEITVKSKLGTGSTFTITIPHKLPK